MRKLRAWFVRLGGFLGGKRQASQDFAQRWKVICNCTSTKICAEG